MADLVIRGRRVVTAEGVRPAAVHVAGGVIDRVAGYDDAAADEVVEVGDAALLPGLVETDRGAGARAHPGRPGPLDGRRARPPAGRAGRPQGRDRRRPRRHAAFRVDPASLHHRHPVTPYAGRMLHGVVLETWLRGRMVHDRGRFAPPAGTTLLRETSAP